MSALLLGYTPPALRPGEHYVPGERGCPCCTAALLTDREQTMEDQVMDSAWTNGMPGGLHTCWVDTVGIDYEIPDRWRTRERLGCVLADSIDENDLMADRAELFRSFVIFEPWAFARAWSIARRLVKSHHGLCARIDSDELAGIHIIAAPKQRVSLDGEDLSRE